LGTVTSATFTGEDGTVERLDGRSWGEALGGQVEFGYEYGPGLVPEGAFGGGGIWRYRRLLPVGNGEIRYPLQVGGTPLVASPRLRVRTGVRRLWFKDETRTPTGSNKDRATALVLEQGLRDGVGTVSCASTGNVAVSLSVGAASCGVRAVIFVPGEVSETKLRLMLCAGASVIRVEEGYEAAFALSQDAARAFGWYDRNTGVNPLTIEAKKTVAFEIWEQLGRRVPDAVVIPVGDGPTYTALVKGFRELAACGVAGGVPRVVGVQAEGCEPLARAWRTGSPVRPVKPRTVADGIAVGAPVSAALVLRDARETDGGFVTVSDEEMIEATATLASGGGILAEPAGAAAFAGLGRAVEEGLIDPGGETVVLVTGSGLKTPQHLKPATAAATVRGGLNEVGAVLGIDRAEQGST
jgi:threonine synthase